MTYLSDTTFSLITEMKEASGIKLIVDLSVQIDPYSFILSALSLKEKKQKFTSYLGVTFCDIKIPVIHFKFRRHLESDLEIPSGWAKKHLF